MAVLYIPTVDLIRLQGRITDRGNIIVNRPVPFNLVKEVWFCVPKENDRRGFELIEKIMDEQLEDELVLEYQASPILREFKKTARLMQLLCEMPPGPHNAEKEKLLHNLATSVDYHHEATRRHHHTKEAVIFMIKHTCPGDLLTGTGSSQIRLRLCPACYHLTPSCLSRCTTCWSLFISRGKFRRNEPVREDSPAEVPSTDNGNGNGGSTNNWTGRRRQPGRHDHCRTRDGG